MTSAEKKTRRIQRKAVLKEAIKHVTKVQFGHLRAGGAVQTNKQMLNSAKLLRDRFYTSKANKTLPLPTRVIAV